MLRKPGAGAALLSCRGSSSRFAVQNLNCSLLSLLLSLSLSLSFLLLLHKDGDVRGENESKRRR